MLVSQESVEDWPEVIAEGEAVKLLMMQFETWVEGLTTIGNVLVTFGTPFAERVKFIEEFPSAD